MIHLPEICLNKDNFFSDPEIIMWYKNVDPFIAKRALKAFVINVSNLLVLAVQEELFFLCLEFPQP